MFKSIEIKPCTLPQPELFGYRLYLLMKLLIKSNEEFCLDLCLHPQLLENLINGRVPPDVWLLFKVSKVYGVSIEWLLYGSGNIFLKKGPSTPFISLRLDVLHYLDPLFGVMISFLWDSDLSEKEIKEAVTNMFKYEEFVLKAKIEKRGKRDIYSHLKGVSHET